MLALPTVVDSHRAMSNPARKCGSEVNLEARVARGVLEISTMQSRWSRKGPAPSLRSRRRAARSARGRPRDPPLHELVKHWDGELELPPPRRVAQRLLHQAVPDRADRRRLPPEQLGHV